MIEIKKPKENDERMGRLKRKMLNQDCVKFNMLIPRHIHTQFKIKASEDRISMSTTIMTMILKYIKNK